MKQRKTFFIKRNAENESLRTVPDDSSQALELYSGRFTTYGLSPNGLYTFNFYEPAEAGQ